MVHFEPPSTVGLKRSFGGDSAGRRLARWTALDHAWTAPWSARGAGSWTGHRLAALIHMHMFDADPVSAALNLTHPCERRIEPFSTLARPRS